jgi:hypothetical protein
MHTAMSRWSRTRCYAGFAVLAGALSLLAGCATEGKVKQASVAQVPSVVKGPSVARLEDGREGFIITEVPQMEESRKDFERAVAALNNQDYGQAIDLLEKVIKQSPGVTAPYINIRCLHAYRQPGRLKCILRRR